MPTICVFHDTFIKPPPFTRCNLNEQPFTGKRRAAMNGDSWLVVPDRFCARKLSVWFRAGAAPKRGLELRKVVGSGHRGYNANMNRYPKIKLSLLRDIGWKLWDPIGLGSQGESWPEDCADEYDRYLLHIVGMLNQGKSPEEAVEYLGWVRAEHMGMGPSTPVERQARVATVQAITAYLQTLPDGPPRVRYWSRADMALSYTRPS